jgi:hypothetical protein
MFLGPLDPGLGHLAEMAAIGRGDGIGTRVGPERGEPMIGPSLELAGCSVAGSGRRIIHLEETSLPERDHIAARVLHPG